MNGINTVILLIFVIVCLAVLVFFKHKENFNNQLENLVTDNLKTKEIIDVQDIVYRDFMNTLVDQLLSELNRLYNKSLIRVNLERVEKTVGETRDSYVVFAFVLNSGKNSVAKLKLEFDVDKQDHVLVKTVDVMGSRPSIFKNRSGLSVRFPVNVKTEVDVDNLMAANLFYPPLESSTINFKETGHKMVDRNKYILPKERERIGDIDTFPSKNVLGVWDNYGVEITEEGDRKLGGLNHGTRQFSLVPQFFKNNFESCIGNYLWLFDTAEGVISRPIGVG